MNRTDALHAIKVSLERALKQPVEITENTDIIGDLGVDSLDGMVFFLELRNETGVVFPDDLDLVEEGYYLVPKLLEVLGE